MTSLTPATRRAKFSAPLKGHRAVKGVGSDLNIWPRSVPHGVAKEKLHSAIVTSEARSATYLQKEPFFLQ